MLYFLSIVFITILVLAALAVRRDREKSRSVAALGLSLAIFLVGMNVQARWVFFIASLLLSAVLISAVAARFSLKAIEVERRSPRRVTEGDTAEVELRVRNRGKVARGLFQVTDGGWVVRKGSGGAGSGPGGVRKALAGRLSLLAGALAGKDADVEAVPQGSAIPPDAEVRVFVPRLGPGEEASLGIPRQFVERGILREGRVELRSGGLLGLASSVRGLPLRQEVAVLPRYAELDGLPAPDGHISPHRSLREQRPSGSSMDFYGVREYRRGDPLRFVHWRTSARLGRLVVREFEKERGEPLGVLVVNPRGCEAGPRGVSLLDNAARIAASFIRCALREGRPVRLAFSRGERMVDLLVGDFDDAREELASMEGDGELSPREMLEKAVASLPAGSNLLVIAPWGGGFPGWLAEPAPSRVRSGVVLLDSSSFGRSGTAEPEEEEGEGRDPVDIGGMPSGQIFVFRKGDDLRACLPGYSMRIGA